MAPKQPPQEGKEPDENTYWDRVTTLAQQAGTTPETLDKAIDGDLRVWQPEIDMASNPTREQLNGYIACTLAEYRAGATASYELHFAFAEDFSDWTVQDFQNISRAFRRELTGLFEERNVKVPAGSGHRPQVAERLYEMVSNSVPPYTPVQRRATLSATPVPSYETTEQPPAIRSATVPYDEAPRLSTAEPTPYPEAVPSSRATSLRPPLKQGRTRSASPQAQHGLYEQTELPYHPPPSKTTYNPYELPPPNNSYNDQLPPEKLVQFQRSWKKENNYSGKPYDILADKTRLFIDVCRRLGIYEQQFSSVFPDILEGRASMYYIHNIGAGCTWKALYEALDKHFNTTVNHSQYFTDWTTMTFARAKQENPDKTSHEALEYMIDKLTLAQRALGPQFKGDVPLHTTIVRACRGHPELEPAMFNTKPTCEALFGDLRAALQVYQDRQAHQYIQDDYNTKDSYYTDRRYTNTRPQRGATYRGRARTPIGPNRFARSHDKRIQDNRRKKCFVCHKEGCWSSNHPPSERTRAQRQYISAYESHYDQAPSESIVTSYITDFEGYPEDISYDESEGDEDLDDKGNQEVIQYLTTTSFLHQMTGEDVYNMPHEGQADQFTLDGRYRTTFQGELWDTGAARVSTVGKDQLEAYLRDNPGTKVDWTPGKTTISFGGQGAIDSIGTVRIKNPLGEVSYHIMDTPTPFLLSLADADRLGAYFNNVLNCIVRKDGTTVPVVRKWGHPFFNVGKVDAVSFLTEQELRRLHRRFGHPRTERLYKMLTKAGHNVDARILTEVEKFCHFCQLYGNSPQRFKFAIRDDADFNYEVIADIVHISNRNVLHVIDAQTSFQAAIFLKSLSARDTWDALCRCWINVYQGPPDFLSHDPGTNFAAEDFQSRAKIAGITCRQMPVEAHWAIGKIERAHAPLRRTFNILKAELRTDTDDEVILQMAVKALNDTAGPDGIVPTLLVFGAYPRINMDSPPSADIVQRATAVRKAMKDIQTQRAQKEINRAINTRNGPVSHDILNVPQGTEVLIWRERKGWTGPYPVQNIEGRDIIVNLDNGPLKARFTHVKRYYRKEEETPITRPVRTTPTPPKDLDEPPPPQVEQPHTKRRGRPRKYPLPERNTVAQVMLTQKEKDNMALAIKLRTDGVITTPGEPFEEADRTEINALTANGTFKVMAYDPAIHTGRIFNLRLVREIKGKNTQPYEKSRLVLAGHSDEEKKEILTQSPTIQRMSQRLLLAVGATLLSSYSMQCELRDITQAYIQSEDKLVRTIFARPPKDLQGHFPPNTILQVVRPLYGAAESGLYWFKTYHNHHKQRLRMIVSSYDPCLLVTQEGEDPFGLTGLQTDDTISIVTPSFSAREEEMLQEAMFKAKPKTVLSHDEPLEFNGGKITYEGTTIHIRQKGQTKLLRTIDPDARDAAQRYVEQRARGAYIASVCQPEAAFDLSVAAQTTEPSKEDIKALNARIQWQIDNPTQGLSYIPLDLARAKLFIFTDGSFANNKDLTSQLGFLIALANEDRTSDPSMFKIHGNIVHWNSIKCKRVTRSVLASELYGMVSGFDNAIAISTTLNQIVRNLKLPDIPVIICTDSKSLYDCLVKLGTTMEKRLMIDVMSLREAYEKREITEIRWINGKDNPADAFTKKTANTALSQLICTNKLSIHVEAHVDRPTKPKN